MPNDIPSLQSLVASLLDKLEHQERIIAKYRHMLFGKSAERYTGDNQLTLQWGTETLPVPVDTETPDEKSPTTRPRRKPLPDHLPRERREIGPEHTCCPDCGGSLKPLGEDTSEQLEYIPAQWKVIQVARPKLACTGCDRIVQAPAPSQPIPRALAGPGLLAHIAVSKYCDHLPLHRQSERFARQGIHIARATMAGWIKQCHKLLDV